MRWIEKFDLFLFDLDGLLVNTEMLHFEAYRSLCSFYGYTLPWNFAQYLEVAHGSSDGLRQALHPHLELRGGEWSSIYAMKKKIYQESLNKGKLSLMPGVEALLTELTGARAKRCVATHSTKEQVETIKQYLPILKTIPVWITREDYEEPKPAPDAYLKAIELLADPGDRIVGFEDSFRGFKALQATAALPVLICDPKHPQLKNDALAGAIHYASFEKIPSNFKVNK